MTSPVGGKPEPTQDRYDDVHSRGSSFGAELNESAVRGILSSQVESPFASVAISVANAFGSLISDVADAISGIIPDGARTEPIKNAIVAKIGPLESEVLALGESLSALSEETMGRIDAQKGLIDDATAAVNEAKDAVAAVKAVADQNKLDITEAVSKAEKASADLAALAPKITAAIDAANKASSDVAELTPQVTSASADAAKANQDIAALSPKVSDAVSKSDKATKDVAALTPKVTAASNKATQAASDVADLTPKVTAAQDKADKAASDLSTLTPKVTAAQKRADAAYTEAGKVRSELSPKITAAQNQADAAVADLAELEPKVTAAQSKADSAFTEAGKVRNEVTPKIEEAQTKGQEALSVADKAVDWLRNPNEIGTSLIVIDPETGRPNWAERLTPVEEEENPLNLPNAYRTSPDNRVHTPRRMWVNIDPEVEYVVSFWAKADKPGSDITIDMRNQAGDHGFADYRNLEGFKSGANMYRPFWIRDIPQEWTYYKHVAIPRENSRQVGISSWYFNHSAGDTTEAIQYIADFQISPLIPSQLDVDQAQNDAIRANTEILRQQQEINAAQATANLAQQNFNDNQQKWNTASSNATKALQDSAALQALLNDAQADINAHQKIFNDNQIKWNTASTNATKALADAAKAQKDINAEQAKFNTFQTDFNKKQTTWNKASSDATQALQDVAKAQEDINAEQQKFNNFQTDFNKKQTAWNNAVDRSIATQKTVNDNFEKWTDGATKAITANADATEALARINGIQIGGRNLLKGSLFQKTSSDYLIHKFPLGDSRPQDGEEVTFSIKAKPGEGITRFRLYNSNGNGSSALFDIYINEQEPSPDGVYKATGKWKVAAGNSHLNVYAFPSSVKTPSEIEWVKLERGNTATDWTPAPEDLPTQAQVDDAQNKAIQANTEFAKQQVEINQLLQEQLWTQQDMVEQLDLQATKIYHGEVSSVRTSGIPSWVGWSSATEHIFPFVHFYTRNDTDRMYKWQLTGSWTGRVKTTTNWSNGAVDVAVFDVATSGVSQGGSYSRTQTTSGGAWGVNLRNVTFEVFPNSLDRECSVAAFDGKYSVIEDEKVKGFPSMVRYQGDRGIRFSCPVKCNKELTLDVFEDGKWVSKTYPSYRMIMPTLIKWSQIPTSANFTEAKVYSL